MLGVDVPEDPGRERAVPHPGAPAREPDVAVDPRALGGASIDGQPPPGKAHQTPDLLVRGVDEGGYPVVADLGHEHAARPQQPWKVLDRKRGLFQVSGPPVSHEIKEVHGVWRAVEERAHAGVGVRGPAYDREARGGHSRVDVFAARDDRVHDVVVHAELDRGIVGDGV